MAIVNRTLDASEQKRTFTASFYSGAAGILNGSTLHCLTVPSDAKIAAIQIACTGLSGAPTVGLSVQRFIVGTGVTTIQGGATTLTLPEWGTSGTIAMVIASSGSSFLNVLANDVLTLTTAGGTGAASKQLAVSIVLQATQDIKTQLGV